MKVKSALISVSNKHSLTKFAKELHKMKIELIASGGTFKALKKAGIPVKEVSSITCFPEIMDGRVKTLHPKIHGGILADRGNKKHVAEAKKKGIPLIDLVAVDLYPFEETVYGKSVSLKQAIEEIDIGGVALLRAAAKNFNSVAVVSDASQYTEVVEELKKGNCSLGSKTREALAVKAFQKTAFYDSVISSYLGKSFSLVQEFPERMVIGLKKERDLRYGENPHQKASLYSSPEEFFGLQNLKQLNGKELSFNNYFDLNSAVELLNEFTEPAAVIVKHNNPSGAALGKTLGEAFDCAYFCDQKSAFGSIIALNRPCDLETAKKICSFFNEAVIAPRLESKALKELKKKKNLRVLELKRLDKRLVSAEKDLKKISGGFLVQEKNNSVLEEKDLKFISKTKPNEKQIADLLFAWKVAKHVKSNAIVLAKDSATIGIGAGQMSRVDAAELAIKKAGQKAENSVMASDAFFPFRDSIELAAQAGVTAIIEPGGSIKDKEVIEEANIQGIALVFTGQRNFRH